jgi:hypothetical protein
MLQQGNRLHYQDISYLRRFEVIGHCTHQVARDATMHYMTVCKSSLTRNYEKRPKVEEQNDAR